MVAQAARKRGISQSEFIRRAILLAAETALDGRDSYGRNSPISGAELVITEQGQAQLMREVLTMKVMLARMYGEAAVAKFGNREAAKKDYDRLHDEVEELVASRGYVFE